MFLKELSPRLLFIIFFLPFISCDERKEKQTISHQVKTLNVTPFLVPKDSIRPPKTIVINEEELIRVTASDPTVVPLATNVKPVGTPSIFPAGTPKITVPGKDTLLLPKNIPVTDCTTVAGIPDVVEAKDPFIKDNNPYNFCSYNKFQGLKGGSVKCQLQDKFGNMWFGTQGFGLLKFDGKYFTNYTMKDGLLSDLVLALSLDKEGNLWFGGGDAVLTKFNGKCFAHYNLKARSPNNAVWGILNDSKGNVWFATSTGMSVFDGKYIRSFTDKEGFPPTSAICFMEDKAGNIWIGTHDNGMSKYDGKSFTTYTKKEGLSANQVWDLYEDKEGIIWIATNGGLNKFDGKDFYVYREAQGMISDGVISISPDKKGRMWLATNKGVSIFDGKTFENFSENEGLAKNFIWDVFEDRSGRIWMISQGGGISVYKGDLFRTLSTKDGLVNNNIQFIFRSKKGDVWMGTEGGLSKFDGKSFTNFTTEQGLLHNFIISAMEDSRGNLWFGTYFGFTKYDGERVDAIVAGDKVFAADQSDLKKVNGKLIKTFTNFTTKKGYALGIGFCMHEDKKGNIWIGSNEGAVKYTGNRVELIESGKAVRPGIDDDLKKVNGSYVKTVSFYSEKQGLSNRQVFAINEDRQKNIWFGTKGGGLTKYDGKDFTHIGQPQGLLTNNIGDIVCDRLGRMWMSTPKGLLIYDGKTFVNITEKDGLTSNVLTSLLSDTKGNIWIGTSNGLNKITREDSRRLMDKIKNNTLSNKDVFFKTYTFDDGFLGYDISGQCVNEMGDGRIITGAYDKISLYNKQGDEEDTITPTVEITGIDIFNESIPWERLSHTRDTAILMENGVTLSDFQFSDLKEWTQIPQQLSLSYNNNYITFKYIGITQDQAKKVRYQCKLDGIDASWSALTKNDRAVYGNLPNGNYTFRVKAMNSQGYWSNECVYQLTIRPPFWKTWWFRITLGILCISIIGFYVWLRERKLKSEKEILERTVHERTLEVVKQKHVIEEKHKEMTDSINYAERIQRSLLASKEMLNANLKEYFVFFRPKAVVSGDFYWAAHPKDSEKDHFILVTADSTGHGVPGAIMSILNISCLKEAVKDGLSSPAEILNQTRRLIIDTLQKDGSTEGGKDGMDCSLINFDLRKNTMHYSTANGIIYIVRNSIDAKPELIELGTDRMPVGKHEKDQIPFTNNEVELKSGDMIYTITDGLPDQFGGPDGKKFLHRRMKDLLIEISQFSAVKQKEFLDKTLLEWKGGLEQVDDITVIGIRI